MIFRKRIEQRSVPGPVEAPAIAPEQHLGVDHSGDDQDRRPDMSITTVPSSAALERLDQAVAGLGPFLAESFIPTSAVTNPLLVVWEVAHEIDPCVSSPVEHLLTVLVARTWLTPSELTATMDEVRAAASQAILLLDALASV